MARTVRLPAPLLALGLIGAVVLTGCTTTVVREAPRSGVSNELAAVAPMLSVERFLQAVNGREFESMAGLFGTVDGPIEGSWPDIELRMATIAEILRHQDYRIVSERREPGRQHPTQRIEVALTIDNRLYPQVPFHVVQTPEGRWMIEQIGLEEVTNSNGQPIGGRAR